MIGVDVKIMLSWNTGEKNRLWFPNTKEYSFGVNTYEWEKLGTFSDTFCGYTAAFFPLYNDKYKI